MVSDSQVDKIQEKYNQRMANRRKISDNVRSSPYTKGKKRLEKSLVDYYQFKREGKNGRKRKGNNKQANKGIQ